MVYTTNSYCKTFFNALDLCVMKKQMRYIVGNWKMNTSAAEAKTLAQKVVQSCQQTPDEVEVALCPPAVWLQQLSGILEGSNVRLGAQDCHYEVNGAYTGNISAAMLNDLGCRYVITGHSERRQHHHESDADVKVKAEAAIAAGLVPIVCVGETLEQRESGKALNMVGQQVENSLPENGAFILAYEPVWAIGSGKVPSADEIAAMHRHVLTVAPGSAVLYGGSVKADNAAEILNIEGVAGVLVGGASLKADAFYGIISSAYAQEEV